MANFSLAFNVKNVTSSNLLDAELIDYSYLEPLPGEERPPFRCSTRHSDLPLSRCPWRQRRSRGDHSCPSGRSRGRCRPRRRTFGPRWPAFRDEPRDNLQPRFLRGLGVGTPENGVKKKITFMNGMRRIHDSSCSTLNDSVKSITADYWKHCSLLDIQLTQLPNYKINNYVGHFKIYNLITFGCTSEFHNLCKVHHLDIFASSGN